MELEIQSIILSLSMYIVSTSCISSFFFCNLSEPLYLQINFHATYWYYFSIEVEIFKFVWMLLYQDEILKPLMKFQKKWQISDLKPRHCINVRNIEWSGLRFQLIKKHIQHSLSMKSNVPKLKVALLTVANIRFKYDRNIRFKHVRQQLAKVMLKDWKTSNNVKKLQHCSQDSMSWERALTKHAEIGIFVPNKINIFLIYLKC